jgi:GT2 family glycosyltransferase
MASTPDASVAIILVNWNGFEFTAACLYSLRKLDYPDFRVILVDNASQNQEGERLKIAFPEIDLIGNSENLGFAGGNNVGIRNALEQGFSYVLMLNNDTIVEPDFLGQMMRKFAQNPRLGVVQPLIYFLHDRTQIWSAGGKWNSFLGRAITLGDRESVDNFKVTDRKLDWATGCCMLITREALLKTGLLNESYFTYFEDVEWSLRFREKRFEIELAAEAKIYHEAGASSKKKHSEGTLSPTVFYYHVRNQFFLLRAEIHGLAVPFAWSYHCFRFLGWMSYFCLRRRFQKLKSVARGFKDGITLPLQKSEQWY